MNYEPRSADTVRDAVRIEAAVERERIQREKVCFRCGDCARFGGDCDAGDSDGNEDRVACEKFVRRAIVPGNAAALRKALLLIRAEFDDMCGMQVGAKYCFSPYRLVEQIDAALSAPVRNCDRFATVDEAKAEWLRTNAKLLSSTGLMPFESWLFAKEAAP